MISSDKVKSILLIGVGLTGAYIALKAYQKLSAAGDSVSNLPGYLSRAFDDAKTYAAETVDEAKVIWRTASNAVTDPLNKLVGNPQVTSNTNADFKAPDYTKQIAPAQWDLATKQFIKAIAKARGTYKSGLLGFDYTGWQVFSDGTIISPWGDYYQMDYTGLGMDTNYGFSVKGIYSSADSPWQLASYDILDSNQSIVDLSQFEAQK